MGLTLFTAAGCARCNVAKKFMHAKATPFIEHDAIGAGKTLFGQFYRLHRAAIFRRAEGVEFPVLEDGPAVRQGVAPVIAWLQAGARLDGFIGRSGLLARDWVGGLHVSQGDPAAAADLAAVGPGVLDGWKIEILTELYHRTMQYLAGDSPATTAEALFTSRRQGAQALLDVAEDPWLARQLDALPDAYLLQTEPEQIADDLHALRATPPGSATAASRRSISVRAITTASTCLATAGCSR